MSMSTLMPIHKMRVLAGAAALFLTAGVAAASPEDNIRAALKRVDPEIRIDSIQAAPVKGLHEVMTGSQILYVTGDGQYFIGGPIIDLSTTPKPTDLTEQRLAGVRKKLIDAVGEDQMVTFGPADAKYTVTVFTDIECGYCRKLHSQMDDYLKEGIRVRYLFYPRAGRDSPAYDEAVSVWCAGDAAARRTALTDAKAGKPVPEKTCDNPVDAHMALGQELGLRGTPAILTERGDLIAGYVEPKRLAAELAGAADH